MIIFIQLISWKTGFLALTLTIVTACLNSAQNQAQNPTVTDTGGMPGMDYGSGMNHSMAMDLRPADADYDLRFIDGMIPHHQGAVEMAENASKKTKRPEIKKIAQDILTSQQPEIEQMQQWRKAWYKQ